MLINCKKTEKDHSFIGDYSTVYSKNILFAIKKYLDKNIYLEDITSLLNNFRIEHLIFMARVAD